MGAWGSRIYESDEGLDIKSFIDGYLADKLEIHLQDIIESMKNSSLLDKDDGYTYDNSILVLAEIIIEYNNNNEVQYNYFDEDDNYQEDVFRNLIITSDDLEFVLNGLEEVVDEDSQRELYLIWEESDSFQMWVTYVSDLIYELQ